jgi:broad specificity phosphatase PhoE
MNVRISFSIYIRLGPNASPQQAKAVGKYSSSYPITHMFTSDLKRAHSTANAIYDGQPDPKPPFTVTPLLREQNFGDGEGKPILVPYGSPWMQPKGRDGKCSNGESVNDVKRRGDRFFEEYLAPIMREARMKVAGEVNVVVVSHGVISTETIGVLIGRSVHVERGGWTRGFRGLRNTAWHRFEVALEVRHGSFGSI